MKCKTNIKLFSITLAFAVILSAEIGCGGCGGGGGSKSSSSATYTVTYDGNGNDIGTYPPADTNVYSQGQTVTVLDNNSTTPLTQVGYSFVGWCVDPSGTGTSYTSGNIFAMGTSNVTLYAKWSLNPTYSVTYDGNGNSAGDPPADTITYEQAATVTVLGNTGNLANSGSTFVGWCVNADGSGTSYTAGQTFAMGASNVTLYAKWSLNPTYTVTYDGNGSLAGDPPTDTNSYEQAANVTVLGNTGNLVKNGNTFVGWCLNPGGTGISYTAGQTFAMGTSNVTLYAKWSVNPTYSVTYDGNLNTSGNPATDTNTYEQGATVTVLGNTGTLVKTGSTFVGWCVNADGSGTSYTAGQTFAMGTTNVTLYAKWSLNPTYTVTYLGNGHTSGSAPTDANTYEQAVTVTVLGNTGSLVKTGSTFVGWCINADGSGTSYTAGQTFAMGTTNVTLYAKWSLNPTYTVTYDGNLNTSGNPPTDTNTYEQAATVTVLGNTGSLVKTGSTFVGWCINADGSGTSYTAGQTFAMGTTNVTLYAKWSLNPTYTVTYCGNGNTGGNAPTDTNHYEQSWNVNVLGNTGSLTKTGNSFVGWCINADGTGTSYSPSDTFAMGTSDVTLYAKWSINPTYTVTYDGNLNTSGNAPTDTNTYEQAATITVLGNTGSLAKTGSTFVGWCINADGSGTSYTAGQTFAMGTSDVTLYAKWSINPTYTVTYLGNGNTGGNAPTDTNHYEQSWNVTVLGNTGSLANTGNTFVGWCVNADGTGTSYSPSDTFPMGTSDVTLYAKWSLNPTYTVTYLGNGNTGGNAPTDTNHYEQSWNVTVLGNTGTLTKSGSSFVGWCINADGTGTSYDPAQTFAMGTSNVTLYAKWSVNPTYTVTYNGNGNTGGNAPTDTNHYEQAATITVLGNTGALAKTGSTFVGWCINADGTGTSYSPAQTFAMGTSNVTLYAKWSVNPTYAVTYLGNGNTSGNPPTDSTNYETGWNVTVKTNSGSLAKTGNTFVGWCINADGSGTSYTPGNTFAMGTSNVTLYAKWSLNPTYNVTYTGNGNTGGNPPTDSTNYEAGSTVTVLGNTGSLTKTGSTFTGWYDAGTTSTYTPGNQFVLDGPITLQAVWTTNPTYTVTYYGNGNTGGNPPTDSTSYETGALVTVMSNSGNLTKTGYYFTGWNTAANGSGMPYGASSTFNMGSANISLYAQWTSNPTYTVTYNGNGNTGGNVPTDSANYQNGATVTVLGNTGSLVRTNYAFSGWNTAANGSGTSYNPAQTFSMGSANVILYAKWAADSSTSWTDLHVNGLPYGSYDAVTCSSDGTKVVAVIQSGGTGAGIYRSTNSGGSWTRVDANNRAYRSVASSSDGTYLLAGVNGGAIYYSTNSGTNWAAGNVSANWRGVAMSSDGSKMYGVVNATTGTRGIYKSTDHGATWSQVGGTTGRTYYGVASSSDGTTIAAIVSGTNGGIYVSTDSGTTWTMLLSTSTGSWRGIAISGDGNTITGAIQAGTYPNCGIWVSTNKGTSWSQTDTGTVSYRCLAMSSDGSKVGVGIKGTTGGYVSFSLNYGANWYQRTYTGMLVWTGIAASSDGSKFYVCNSSGGSGGSIWLYTQ
jgi:uncharacterized repeat protein (TIGR02543 family)